MNAEPLTPERILDTAEEVLRRFGPRKTTVVDVARALDVSHGTVYRHFASKSALRDAVSERWLHRVSEPLWQVARGKGPADKRLRRWFDTLIAVKRAKVRDLVDSAFGGRAEELMLSLLQHRGLSKAEAQRIRQMLDEAAAESRPTQRRRKS